MRVKLGGSASAPCEEIAAHLLALGHRVVVDASVDLCLWLDLGPGRRPPLPAADGPLLVLTDRRTPGELEALLGSSGAEWMRWPEEADLLPMRMRTAQQRLPPADWAGAVAHEINNPLTYLFANLELLERKLRSAGGETHHLVEEALHGAERIRAVVASFRTLHAPEEARLAAVDLQQVLESAVRVLQPELQRRAVVICDFAPVPTLRSDEVRLGQVFVNLIGNALHAMPGRPVTENLLRIALRRGADEAIVEIVDNGVGIDPSVRQRIFEPFFTTRPGAGGSGLGLPIARGIVEAAGGTIEVESEPGRGSLFRVRLPLWR